MPNDLILQIPVYSFDVVEKKTYLEHICMDVDLPTANIGDIVKADRVTGCVVSINKTVMGYTYSLRYPTPNAYDTKTVNQIDEILSHAQ